MQWWPGNTQAKSDMKVPGKRRVRAAECVHQCTKCGLMYDCGQSRCGRPFYSGVCERSAALTRDAKTIFGLA